MNNFRQPAMSLVVFAVFVGLITLIYSGFSNEYNFTTDEQMLNGTLTMSEKMESLNLLNTITDISNDIISIASPSNPLDVLGSLAASGIGVTKLVYQIVTYPVSIIDTIVFFYNGIIPDPIISFVKVVWTIILAFVILSIFLKRDV